MDFVAFGRRRGLGVGLDWQFAGPIIIAALTGLFMVLSTRNSATATREAASINAAATTKAAEIAHEGYEYTTLQGIIKSLQDVIIRQDSRLEAQSARLDHYATALQEEQAKTLACEQDRISLRGQLNDLSRHTKQHLSDLEQATTQQMFDLENLHSKVDNAGDDGLQPRIA